ncbi:MAG: hypothetical protein LBM08_04790 [Dysgonamonadaceae bacterium]|jgi:hypothetical protein|nr:hypothetical protein [Dysgonamonadaceae bacterium]
MEEIWKDIKDYEGCYQVSNLGRIRSLSRIIQRKNGMSYKVNGKIFTGTPEKDGYLIVHLRNGNVNNHARISRLVAATFIPNTLNKSEVNHMNGMKTDNRVENLEWATSGENITHAYRILNRIKNKNLLNKTGDLHPTSKAVLQFDLNGSFIARYESARQASLALNKSASTISKAISGKTKISGGFIWKYEDSL